MHISEVVNKFVNRSPRNRAIVVSVVILAGLVLISFWVDEILPPTIVRIIAGFLILSFFVLPLIRQRGKGGNYWDKFIADQMPRKRINTARPIRMPGFRDFGFRVFIYLILIVAFITAIVFGNNYFRQTGKREAEGWKEFKVVAQYLNVPEVVVIRIYGDYLIAVPLVRSTDKTKKNEVKKEFYLLKISEMSKIPLVTEEVGPLKVIP
jgi:hypothetical protein